MKLIAFDHRDHKEAAETLLSKRGMSKDLTSDLPQYGSIVFEGTTPVAMGFIRRIEGPYAMLDSFITNPDIDHVRRDKALNYLTKNLTRLSGIYNITKLIAFSADENTVSRAVNHGFGIIPHKCLILKF